MFFVFLFKLLVFNKVAVAKEEEEEEEMFQIVTRDEITAPIETSDI